MLKLNVEFPYQNKKLLKPLHFKNLVKPIPNTNWENFCSV